MKKHYSNRFYFGIIAFALTFHISLSSQNVTVAATGGTTTGSYATLSAAFAAINNGTHTGSITLSIVNDIIAEPASPTALGASLAPANYSSVLIVPIGNRIIQSTSNNNRSVIELFGADNVTIDGDDPNTAGKQNLSLLVSTGSFNNSTAAIRIGSVNTTNPCQNIVIKNCIIKGCRLSNSQAIINFGIVIGSNNTADIVNSLGTNNRDIIIDNNDISRCYRAIWMIGTIGSENKNIAITRNKIGVTSNIQETVGQYGIFTFASSATGAGNESKIDSNEIVVQVPGTTGLTGGSIGIFVQNGNNELIIRNNNIHDIINNNSLNSGVFPPTHNVAGIQVVGASNNNLSIYNNIIRDVISARKQTLIPNDANYGIYMLNFGLNTRVHHNTIGLLTPNTSGTTANALSYGILIHGNGVGTMADYSNNIIVNKNASTAAFCVWLNSLVTVANATMNKNCYYFPSGSCGNSGAPFTLSNWQSVTGRDLQSFVENPPFKSATNLLISPGVVTQLESSSSGSIINLDIENDQRPGPAGSVNGGGSSPDVGADEFDGISYVPPVILGISHDPLTQSCSPATARTVGVIFSTLGNAFDSVMIEYSINGGAKTVKKMSSVSATGFEFTIPAAIPVTGIVQYRVYAMTRLNDTITSNYNYYNDNTANGALLPVLSATPTQACPTSTVDLNYTFLPDPTGFNFPPTIASPTTNVDITNVKLNIINNTSAINSLTGTIGTATGNAGEYSNYRNLVVDTFSLGKSYPITVTSNASTAVRTYFSGFADFNGDGDFNDVGENLFNTLQVKQTGGRTEKFSLYIPPYARPGKTCVRIICSSAPILNAFTNFNLGEIEEYSIYIRPLKYTWMTGATVIGSGIPQPFTTTATLPNTVYLELTDSSQPTNCTAQTIGLQIVQAPAAMNVTISAPAKSCYGSPSLVKANVTGGCPPYTYTWSNISANQSSQFITLYDNDLNLTVTVVDKNGTTYSATATILKNNPKLTFVPDTQIICNRGTTRFTVNTAATDSAYWYKNLADAPYAFDSVGKNYTTQILSSSRAYYVAAFNSSSVFAGKLNQTGTTSVTASGAHILNSGLKFTVVEPIQILNCQMYYSTGVTPSMNIAILDKYGSIITQTGLFTPPTAASAAVATTVPLNFIITNPDTGYRIVLLQATNIATLSRNITGQAYPTGPALPMIITGAYSIPAPTSNDYFYFYNFRILKGMCVGEKRQVFAKVRPPVVPAIKTDLAYTQLCKGDSLKLKISTDTFGNRFVWTKNDIIQPDISTVPPSDTTKDSTYRILTGSSDTGLYRVRIFSTKFCTRDTFSREVRVSFYPEPLVKKTFPVTNICTGTNTVLNVEVENGYKYIWKRNNVPTDTLYYVGNKYISTAAFTDAGNYRLFVTDTNGCRTDTSISNLVNVFNHPQITLHPLDTVLCENDRYVIYAKASNATNYQWYHDNGIMNSFTKDSLTLYAAQINDSGTYRLIASSYPGCNNAITNIAKIVVNPVPKIFGIYPPTLKICEGTKLKLVSSTKDVLNVQWLKNNNPTGVTSDSFVQNNSSLTTSGTYNFIAKSLNKCKDLISDTTNVTVVKKPSVNGFLPNLTLCEGREYNGGFNIPAGSGGIYQWYKNNVPLQGAIDSQLKIRFIGITDTGLYYLKVNTDLVCAEAISGSFKLFVQPAPVIEVQPVGATGCMGENFQLVVVSKNGNGFQWKKDGLNQGGGTSNTFNITNLSASKEGKYTVTVKGVAPCLDTVSDTAYVRHRSGNTNAYAPLVSIYNAVEQCTDINNWTYYSPQDDETKYIFAVKKRGNIFTGKADIVVRPSVFQNVNNSGNEYSSTIMMRRFWNFKLESGDLIDPVDVKFYYNKSDEDELRLKVLEIKNLYNNELTLEDPSMLWFKTDSIPFTNTLIAGIRGNTLGFKINDLTSSFITGIENNTPYIELKGITNIGGGSVLQRFKGAHRVITGISNGQSYSASMYPNPNNGNFILNVITKKTGKIGLAVINQLGQTIYTQDLKLNGLSTDSNISIPNIANGIYQLILTKDNETSAIKFTVEN